MIHQDKSILVTTNREAVAKCNIHMDSIQIEILGFVEGKTALGFGDGGKRAQRRGKFATINPFAITTHLKQSLVIPKLAATHSTMKLLRQSWCPSYWRPYHRVAQKGEKSHPDAVAR